MICWFGEKYIVVVWYWFSCKWMSSISQHIFPILIIHGKASIICAETDILSVWNNTSRLSASCFRQKYHYPAPGFSPIETCCLSSQFGGISVSLDCDGSVMAAFPRWLVRWGFTSASIYLFIKLHGNLSFEIPRDIQRWRRAEHTFDFSGSISNKYMIFNRLFVFLHLFWGMLWRLGKEGSPLQIHILQRNYLSLHIINLDLSIFSSFRIGQIKVPPRLWQKQCHWQCAQLQRQSIRISRAWYTGKGSAMLLAAGHRSVLRGKHYLPPVENCCWDSRTPVADLQSAARTSSSLQFRY